MNGKREGINEDDEQWSWTCNGELEGGRIVAREQWLQRGRRKRKKGRGKERGKEKRVRRTNKQKKGGRLNGKGVNKWDMNVFENEILNEKKKNANESNWEMNEYQRSSYEGGKKGRREEGKKGRKEEKKRE